MRRIAHGNCTYLDRSQVAELPLTWDGCYDPPTFLVIYDAITDRCYTMERGDTPDGQTTVEAACETLDQFLPGEL